MFNVIDKKIINIFQWFVRQIELNTSITREQLLFGFANGLERIFPGIIILIVYVSAPFLIKVIFTFLSLSQNIETLGDLFFIKEYYIPINFIPLYVGLLNFRTVAELLNEITDIIDEYDLESELLPEEILSRFRKRFYVFSIIILTITVIFFTVLVAKNYNVNVSNDIKMFILLSLAFTLLFLSLEYLLCTTSLPPNERARKKQEREMSRLSPQLT